MESAMSRTPIFDQLFEEFMEEHRYTPSLAISQSYYAYDFPASTPDDTVELLEPPLADTQIILTDEDTEDWVETMDREINEAMNHLKPVVMFTATADDALSKFGGAHPFVGLMSEHQNAILYPDKMPTREMLGLLPLVREEAEPEEPVEDQHVFPITREGGRVKFLQDPDTGLIKRVRAGLHGLLYDEVSA